MTLLFYSGSFIEEIESYQLADLSNIISWLGNNYLFLNCKTKVMLVGIHQRLSGVTCCNVSAFYKTFRRVYQFKYVGIMLDPGLSWSNHIDHIVSKISA